MPFTEADAYCDDCRRWVLARAETPNHVLHAILTLFMCGLWGIVWIIICVGWNKPLRCTRCGSTELFEDGP